MGGGWNQLRIVFSGEFCTSSRFMDIVEKPPRNSARFCGGGHGLNCTVEPRKEERSRFMDRMWENKRC
jgi:hypothetical protein